MIEMRKKGTRYVVITPYDKIDALDRIAFRLMRCLCTNNRCAECPAYRPDAEINDRCDVMKINELIIRIQNRLLIE